MAMTATLDVTDLRKQFSIGRPAVDGVSFAVPAGETVVLLGPSGCGKTTTLRCVAGLEHPTAGTISISGRVVSSPAHGIMLPPRLRNIGMVFQSYAVWPHMTVRQNVIYPLKHRKIGRADAGRKVDEVLELVGLSEYADRPVVALSGGQMQRVALARSIVYRPQLLLLDEPLSNLDAKLRLRLRDDLRRILKATGTTALYVTHDQAEAVVLGNRIGVMRDGKLLQMGTPDEIYNRPADLFVANFTGATNEITGTLIERNGRFGVVDIGGDRRVEVALLHELKDGEKTRIALRPENILIGPHKGSNALDAQVLDRRYQGTQTIYDIDLYGQKLEVVELGTAARYEVGANVPISLPRDALWAYRDQSPVVEWSQPSAHGDFKS
ncbi:MAG TPA: ABC transporter ATP-binding protein [Pseudolabrys sp.]|jgi:iron(III) transport system ATP-binding protein|nr:ABC transporter ATP-binding protein [Pseudolabrys sp.]